MNKFRFIGKIVFLFAIFAMPLLSSAATFGQGKANYYIQKEKVVKDDLYAIAGNVISYGEIMGDFFSAGNSVLVMENVSEDVNVAGGNVDVLSDIGGDVRVIGGQVKIGGEIGEDLIVIGGTAQILPDANIKGDVVLVSGAMFIDGKVGGDLRVIGGDLILGGEVVGNADIKVDQKLTIRPNVSIEGDLVYEASEEAEIPETANIAGEINFTQKEGMAKGSESKGFLAFLIASVFSVVLLLKIGMLILSALLAVFLIPKFSKNTVELTTENFLRSLGIGLISLITIPFASVLLLVSIIGLPIGALGVLFYIAMFIASGVFAGISLGAIIARWRGASDKINWRWVALGVLLFELLVIVPFVGWAIRLLFFLVAFGAISTVIYRFLQKRK